MKVSVIIPCRNEEGYIEQTLRSLVVQQNVPGEYEIIVVDGMSDDKTREIVGKLKEQFPRIKLVENKKKITPVALNLGIKNSQGEYVCILGAHSVYSEYYLSQCLNLFSVHPEVSCVGGPILSEGRNNFSAAVAIAMSSSVGVGNAKHRFPNYEGYAEMACFPMFHRSVFDKIGFYDETLIKNQDDDFCFRLRKTGGKIYISPAAQASYYVRNDIKSLFRQYFQYGLWRVAVTKKHTIPISFRQLIPSLYLTSCVILIVLGLVLHSFLIMLILPLIYLSILFVFSLVILVKNNLSIAINIPLAVIILHFAYGIGFFAGLYKFRKKLSQDN